MPTPTEIQRLAAATNALRPDWPVTSLVTFLTKHHTARAYTDLAVALAVIATDSRTKTPARLNETGPWWHVLPTADGTRPVRVACPDHPQESAGRCRQCAALAVPAPPEWRAAADEPASPALAAGAP